ncbi:MAG: TonB-dependent receptor [Rhodoferax sp.]
MKNFASPARARVLARLSLLCISAAGAHGTLAQNRLPEVVVTATRFAEPADNLPFGVSVITASEIQAAGVGSVNEAVMKLMGVVGRLDTAGGTNYTLDLRGFGTTAGSNQIVIVDGLRLNEADLSSAGLASIPIAAVERIEVLRGTGAVLYGEGATGGVIVITTKAGIGAQRKSSAQLYGAAGSLGLREARGTAVIAAGGFSVDVSASERRSDGHRVNFASESDAVSATGQWSNDWLRLGARIGRDALSSGLPRALSAAQFAADPRQANSLTEYGASQSRQGGLFAEALLGDWQIAADVNRRDKRYDSLTFAALYAYDVTATNASLRARHTGQLGKLPNSFILGWDRGLWERTITQSLFTPIGSQATAQSTAFYVRDELTLPGTGTRLSAGWRTEGIRKFEGASAAVIDDREQAWELGVSQPVGKGGTVYGRVGSSFRLGNVDEFSFTNPAVTLRAQTSRDLELGARWKGDAGTVEARWYRSRLRDEIGYDPSGNGPFGPFGANINFDPTLRQGLELEARHALSADVDLRLNAAWRQARFTAGQYAGNDVMLVPKRTLAVRADWRPAAGHSLHAGVQWVSSQSPDFANTCRMPAYASVDLRYAYQWGAAELALGIANLTDRKYYTLAFACTAGGVATSVYPEPGRTFTASVRYAF